MSAITMTARQHEVSPGLWALAWRRLKSDKVGMVSLVIVALFFALVIASSLGLIAKDWSREVGINYAPPTWFHDDAPPAPASGAPEPEVKAQDDPGVGPGAGGQAGTGEAKADESSVVDPLAEVLKEVRTEAAKAAPVQVAERL